jgi:hypothetical protein
MKTFVAVSFAGLLLLPAADPGLEKGPARSQRPPRRLETVTWNSVDHQLTWVISSGARTNSGYTPLTNENYQISMDRATMTFHGETRGFSRQEAVNVRVLMDLISQYAMDSTVWWDNGQGVRLDGKDRPKRKEPETSPSAIIHISMREAGTGGQASLPQVRERIRQLESQLAAMKRLEGKLLSARRDDLL